MCENNEEILTNISFSKKLGFSIKRDPFFARMSMMIKATRYRTMSSMLLLLRWVFLLLQLLVVVVMGDNIRGTGTIVNQKNGGGNNKNGSTNGGGGGGEVFIVLIALAIIPGVAWLFKYWGWCKVDTSNNATEPVPAAGDDEGMSHPVQEEVERQQQLVSQREQQMEARRKERRDFYVTYIEPYTMVVTDKDFIIKEPKFKRTKKVDVFTTTTTRSKSDVTASERSSSSEDDGDSKVTATNTTDLGDIEMGTISTTTTTSSSKGTMVAVTGTTSTSGVAVAADAADTTSSVKSRLKKNQSVVAASVASYPISNFASVDDYICQEIINQDNEDGTKVAAASMAAAAKKDGGSGGGSSSGSDDEEDHDGNNEEEDVELEELDNEPIVYLQLRPNRNDTRKPEDVTEDEKVPQGEYRHPPPPPHHHHQEDEEEDVHMKQRNKTTVDNNCAICLAEYEVGDKVVWSALEECPHAFHHDCILQWLAKGKKRCPICRQWFVPGLSVQEQITAAAAANAAANATTTETATTTQEEPQEQQDGEEATATTAVDVSPPPVPVAASS